MLSVHELRQRGFKVQVRHHRCYEEPNQFGKAVLSSKGGATEILVSYPPQEGVGPLSVVGVAECSPKENFNRKRGVRIALGRALKKMGMCTK